MNSPRALLVAYAVVVLVALVVAGTTSSAAFGAYNPAWDGATDLQAEADAVGAEAFVVRNTTEYASVSATESVAVVLSPDREYTDMEVAPLRTFVRTGGILVVAEDFGNHSNDLLAAVGADARVDGRLLRDERHHDRSPAMPVATNVSNAATLEGADQLTMNYGTAVEPNGATVLVASSGFAYLDKNRNDDLDDDEDVGTYPVVTVEEVGAGRVIVVGDPSLLINAMLDQPDNRAFVRGLFGGQEHVLLDYSHAERLPPLSVARLTVQRSPLLQLVLGLVLVVWIAGWQRRIDGTSVRKRLPSVGRASADRVERTATEEELVAYVRRQHPEWDDQRVGRVVRTALASREDGDDSTG